MAEAIGAVQERIGPDPDLAIVIASGALVDRLPDAVEAVSAILGPAVLVGVTASGLVAGGEELVDTDAITVWAGHTGPLSGCRLEAIPGSPPLTTGLPTEIEPGSTLIVLADPYSFPVEPLLDQLRADHLDVQVVGGLASLQSGANRLWLGQEEHRDGAVCVVLPPGVAQPVVSQGCRPVGKPWIVTGAAGPLLLELGGAPALDRLEEAIDALGPRDRLCAAQGLHVGIAADELVETHARGDFLIRGVLGADRDKRAVAVGAQVNVGQTVQFQVRDAESAHEDLVELLDGHRADGALVFTCTGRGPHLFAEENHDAALVSEHTDGGVAGFFCAGELGPVGKANALHGFTATVLLFNS